MLRTFVVLIALIISSNVQSQLSQESSVSVRTAHLKIDAAQKDIYGAFLKAANVNITKRTLAVPPQILFSLFDKVAEIENYIQTQPIDTSKKIVFLNGLQEALRSFEYYYKTNQLNENAIGELMDSYKKALDLDWHASSIFPVVRESAVEIGAILVTCSPFKSNIGIYESKEFVVSKAFQKNPNNILPVLFDIPDVSIVDSLIKVIAKTQVENIYKYSQATDTELGRRIQNINEPLIKFILKLANLHEGQLYFPFLDNLFYGRISMDDIRETLGEAKKVQYYQLLVKTWIDYTGRMAKGDTALAVHPLIDMLRQKAVESFVNDINSLHDFPDQIRLKIVKDLNAQELYYLVVLSENEIYTSSYLKLYSLIYDRTKKPDSYRLLESVHFDHSKKFIKMAANYNTLNDFLKRTNPSNAEGLIKSLPNQIAANSLEDAVDVADTYSSILDKHLRKLILEEVTQNLSKLPANDEKRVRIYHLLQTLFLSLDTSRHIDVSKEFGIPSVYSAENTFLRDRSGKIIIQQFFYGDKDGIAEFKSFMNAFSNANWETDKNPEWITTRSKKGVPVVIYSNRPLDKTKDLDARAQEQLCTYLEKKSLQPSIVIHRGHSYHLSSTIDQLAASSKVILLGSCGGYHNLNKVLRICPYAQIISTKQEGSGRINEPMIVYLTDLLRHGKDLDWEMIWKHLETKFKNNQKFKDYIPPHKNLGAVLIMAYESTMGKQWE
jgi:hypothetical protein